MTDQLYQDRIVALAKAKTGAGKLASPSKSARRDNPLCGDRVVIDVKLDDGGKIAEIAHQVRGCLLCQAAAAVIGERAPGRTPSELRNLVQELGEAIAKAPEAAGRRWPELAAFAPVHPHKSRHECVMLPFQALTQALDQIEGDSH